MASASTIIYLICKKRSLLLAKEASVNTTNYIILASNLMNLKPLFRFLIYQFKRLLRPFMSFLLGLITWVAKDKLNKASS